MMTLEQVMARTGWSRRTIYRRMEEGFPRPKGQVVGTAKLWDDDEVEQWIRENAA